MFGFKSGEVWSFYYFQFFHFLNGNSREHFPFFYFGYYQLPYFFGIGFCWKTLVAGQPRRAGLVYHQPAIGIDIVAMGFAGCINDLVSEFGIGISACLREFCFCVFCFLYSVYVVFMYAHFSRCFHRIQEQGTYVMVEKNVGYIILGFQHAYQLFTGSCIGQYIGGNTGR